MTANPRTSKGGFTLVEILIVVIILGILAAIVIPQFTSASQDARKNSLSSQLQTLRSQLELYKLQHRDALPDDLVAGGPGDTAWNKMTVKTDADHTVNTAGQFGPYLQAVPTNPLNGFSAVAVVTTDQEAGDDVTGTNIGFVLNTANGKLWGTSKSGGKIYNEADPNATSNDE